MAGKNQYTAKEFIDAIPGTGGVITAIARRVGCDWNTAKKYITEYVTVKEAYEAEKASVDDVARSVVIQDIMRARNVDTAKWWLRMKLSDEFSDKTRKELTGPDGEPLTITWEEVNPDDE